MRQHTQQTTAGSAWLAIPLVGQGALRGKFLSVLMQRRAPKMASTKSGTPSDKVVKCRTVL